MTSNIFTKFAPEFSEAVGEKFPEVLQKMGIDSNAGDFTSVEDLALLNSLYVHANNEFSGQAKPSLQQIKTYLSRIHGASTEEHAPLIHIALVA